MRDKYQKEIEELLRKLEEGSGRRLPGRRPRPWDGLLRSLGRMRPASPGQIMLMSIVLLIVGLVGMAVPFFRGLGRPMAVVAVFLFTVAYLTSFMRPPFRMSQGWRGREVQLDTRGLPWWQKLYLCIYRY